MPRCFRAGWLLLVLLAWSGLESSVQAEVQVALTDMHICCGSCVKGIERAVATVDRATVQVDKDDESCSITAFDAATAQKAINALATAGYHANVKDKVLAMPSDSGAPAGNVKKLTVTGAHNCCTGCAKAILSAVSEVPGATVGELKGKQSSFEITGDFSALQIVEELNEHGFHVQVK